MLLEANAVDLTDRSLLSVEIGGLWDNFKLSITDHNAYCLDTSYNLIRISDPNTLVGQIIQTMLVDESTDVSMKLADIRNLLITNIIGLISQAGIKIDEDMVNVNQLPLLNSILDLIYILNGFEDLLSLSEVLESSDIPTVDRFIRVLALVNDLDDTTDYEELILDVSETLIEVLRRSLITHDDVIPLNPLIRDRILNNKPFLKGTLAGEHLLQGGNFGGSLATLIKSWANELSAVESDNQAHYVKEIIALAILSDVTDGELLNEVNRLITDVVIDPSVLFKADAYIKSLNLVTANE